MQARPTKPPRWVAPVPVPECPVGWRTGPPDFVGVGAQRSGTTWWYRVLLRHQQIATPDAEPKELHYFDRFWTGEVPEDFIDTYHRLFPRPPGSIAGEWTPRYMYDFWSMRLLRQAAPEARLLIMIRDPVERYRSGAARQLRKAQQDGVEPHLGAFGDAVHRSLYHEQLRRVFDLYPRDQVLLLQHERCVRDPLAEMDRTLDFLGLEPFDEVPQRLTQRSRPAHPKPPLSDAMRADLVARLREDVRRVAALCPEIDVSLWRNFSDLAVESPALDDVAPSPGDPANAPVGSH